MDWYDIQRSKFVQKVKPTPKIEFSGYSWNSATLEDSFRVIDLKVMNWSSSQSSSPAIKEDECIFYSRNLAEMDYGKNIYIVFVPILLTVSALGLINNGVSFLVLRKMRSGSTPNFFLQVLAIADSFVLITYAAYYAFPSIYEYYGALEGYYEFFQLTKRYIWFLVWYCKTCSVYTTLVLTTDRYIAVCYPLKARAFTLKHAKLSVIGITLFSLLYNLPKIWYVAPGYFFDECTNRTRPMSVYTEVSQNHYFNLIYVNISYLVIMYFIPLFGLSVLNLLLILALRRAAAFRKQQSTSQASSDGVTERIIGIVTAFVVLETPSIIINSILIVDILDQGPSQSLDMNVLMYVNRCSYVISAVNSTVNLYIYFCLGPKFRKICMEILVPKAIREKYGVFLSSGIENDPTKESTNLRNRNVNK